MDKDKFKELLKIAGLTKKSFSEVLEVQYNTVNAWGNNNNIPYWVESWLTLYIENEKFKKLKQVLKDSGAYEQ